jgi:putative membrane protein
MIALGKSKSASVSKAAAVHFVQSQNYTVCKRVGPPPAEVVPDEANPEKFPEPHFWIPREDRDGRSVFRADNTLWFGQTRLARNDRRDPSRDLNFTDIDWYNHKSPYRRIRHMLNIFNSSTFQRLSFPELFSTATVAVGLAYYNEVIASGAHEMMTVSPQAFGGATTALGILAGFRLNASYGRYEECRIFWGDTNNTIRDLARETMMWMKDPLQQKRMLKLCKAYPVVLNFHLNGKGGHHNILRFPKDPEDKKHSFKDRVHTEFLCELRDIYKDGRDETDYQRMAKVKYNGGNTPIEVLNLMGETIAGSVGTVDAIYVREMDEQCQRLCAAFGASERVLRTSLPTSFTRHTSRLMWVWSNALPFALYPSLGPIGTLPAAVFTSWAIQSIEDIGVQIEEPFNVLPLRQYSDGMFDAIGQIERNYRPYTLPSLEGGVAVVDAAADLKKEAVVEIVEDDATASTVSMDDSESKEEDVPEIEIVNGKTVYNV